MSNETLSPITLLLSQQSIQEAVEDSSRQLSNLSIEQETRIPSSPVVVDSSPEWSPAWHREELVSLTETQELLTELEPKDELNRMTDAGNPSSQSSVLSDLTFQSLLIQPQNSGHDSQVFGSQSVVVVQDNADSSDSLTFPQSVVEKVWDNTTTDIKRLSTVQAIASFPRIPSDVAMEHPRAFETEITEASGNDEEEPTRLDSGVSTTSKVVSPVTYSDTAEETRVENSRKRRRFWQNLRDRRRAIVCFPKRLCRCLAPRFIESTTETTQYPVYEIKALDIEEGIVRSRVTIDSPTSKLLEQLVDQYGGFIILKGAKLDTYQARLDSILSKAFDRQVGYSVLNTWKSEKPEQSLELLESVHEIESYRNRVLTLADIDLTQVKRTTRSDDRENTLFRYFKSYQGLNQRMLAP
eukprot:g6998.t1